MHPPRILLVAGIALASLGCATDSPPPEPNTLPAPAVLAPPAAAEPPTTEDTIYEVTLASTPTGAQVRLSGAEIGSTPYILKYKRSTTVEITAPSYLPATVTVDETSDPNVVVALQPDPAAAMAAAATSGTAATGTATPGTATAGQSAKPSSGKPTPTKTDPTTPTASTDAPATPKPASGLPYPDVAAAKADYQKGRIDRDAYDQAVRKLKVRRNDKIAVIRAKYQAGEIDKDEYARRKRIIDNEYKGAI